MRREPECAIDGVMKPSRNPALLTPLGRVAPLINRPHRFGDFRVLKAPDIPSVLIELGFLSNDQDAERLTSKSHRRALAGAILQALDNYFRRPC